MYKETCCSGQFGDHGYSKRIDDHEQITSGQWDGARKLAAKLQANFRKSSRTSFNDQTMLQCRCQEDHGEGTVFHDLRRCGTGQIGRLMSRVYFTSRQRSIKVKRWIRGNTKIGPALEVAISHHQGRHGIEIMVNSLSGDGTCSWVMIVGGTNKYETEVSEGTQENHMDDTGDSTGKFVAKAGPKQTPIPTSSSTATLPYHQRDWIDVEQGPYDKSCFEVSKKMIRLLRHDPSVFQEEDGAVEFRILAPMFRSERLLSIGQFEHG